MTGDTNITNPDQVRASGGILRDVGQASFDRITELVSEIRGLESGKPWGTTESFGKAFERVYLTGDGGADYVKDHAAQPAKVVQLTGEKIVGSMDNSTLTDDATKRSFTVDGGMHTALTKGGQERATEQGKQGEKPAAPPAAQA